MLDFGVLGRNPVSTATLCVCLWAEVVFFRSLQDPSGTYTPIFRGLGAGRSVLGQWITALSNPPLLPLLLIALSVTLIYKELRLQDRRRALVINVVTCAALLVLPFLLAAEFRSELQALLGQLGT